MKTDSPPAEVRNDEDSKTSIPCLSYFNFQGNAKAKAYALAGAGRSCVIMSNIFLSTSFIWLASEDVDCIEDGAIDGDCENKVYGFKPSSLISNIAIISGLAAAFFMPFIGAIIDYTPHRRTTGIISAACIILIQAIQIFTLPSTWFIMSILQAIAGFLYQVQVLAVYAYLPEIARDVGEFAMTAVSSSFTEFQFGIQFMFLLVIVVIGLIAGTTTVVTAQISQGLSALFIVIFWKMAWEKFPNISKKHDIPQGSNFVTIGFVQNYDTLKIIKKHYRRGLFWYFLGLMFAEAGSNAFTTVSVTFLVSELNMSSSGIGISFLVTLLATLPGTKVALYVTRRTDPNTSWKLCQAYFSLITIAGAFFLNESRKNYTYIFNVLWGIALGWFYPTENLFFSMCLPKGKEAELSGFYVYCSNILNWLPPLIFTLLNEFGVSLKYGLMSITAFFFTAIIILSMTAPWSEIVEESAQNVEEGLISN